MLVVTHEMQFARRVASRAVVLADGRIADAGAPGDVLDAPRTAATRALLGSRG
jgi:ABC-type histidine transport system ATPase subunit